MDHPFDSRLFQRIFGIWEPVLTGLTAVVALLFPGRFGPGFVPNYSLDPTLLADPTFFLIQTYGGALLVAAGVERVVVHRGDRPTVRGMLAVLLGGDVLRLGVAGHFFLAHPTVDPSVLLSAGLVVGLAGARIAYLLSSFRTGVLPENP